MCHLQELYSKYKDKGLVVLGLDPADDKKIGLDLLRDNGATFPNIIDSSEAANRVANKDYPLAAWPTTYIIGRDGKVVDAWLGFQSGETRGIAALRKTGGALAEAICQDEEATAKKSAAEVAVAAQRLFQAIRTADYNRDWIGANDWKNFPAKDAVYEAGWSQQGWVRWVCAKFKANPITDVQLGKVVTNSGGRPTVHFELRLKDGKTLQGNLRFVWDPTKKCWSGRQGLDWHLHDIK
jgi:hypothetical protein